MTKSREQLKNEIQDLVFVELYNLTGMQNVTPAGLGTRMQYWIASAVASGIDHAMHNMTDDQFEKTFGLNE